MNNFFFSSLLSQIITLMEDISIEFKEDFKVYLPGILNTKYFS